MGTGEDKREPKHLVFHDCIERIANSVNRLACLCEKIEEGERPSPQAEKNEAMKPAPMKPTPSLAVFLAESPRRLNELNAELLQQINRLEEMLF